MAWQDELRPASFRGVPFKVEVNGGTGGRRLAVHEYPQRDKPFAEDMGKVTGRIPVTAYVIGPNYIQARDRLIEACNAKGPGALSLPTRSEIQVSCEPYRYSESKDEGGMCRFDLSFVEGDNRYPVASTNSKSAVFSAATTSIGASRDAFSRIYLWRGLLDFVPETIAEGLRTFASVVEGARGIAADVVGDVTSQLADATRLIYGTADGLARSADIGQQVADTLSLFRRAAADGLQAQKGLQALRDYQLDLLAPIYATDMRAIQQRNAAALTNLVREVAVAEQARAVTVRPLASYDEAVAVRDEIVADLETVILSAGDRGDDDVYVALTGLLSTVTQNLTERGASLERVIWADTARPLPSLVVAHRLYQSVDRESEIIDRNPTPHPAWMRPRLEALTR